jgi:hypothetical protein
MMGMELVPETSYFLNILTRLVARENFIKSCRRESLKSYILCASSQHAAFVIGFSIVCISTRFITLFFLCQGFYDLFGLYLHLILKQLFKNYSNNSLISLSENTPNDKFYVGKG